MVEFFGDSSILEVTRFGSCIRLTGMFGTSVEVATGKRFRRQSLACSRGVAFLNENPNNACGVPMKRKNANMLKG
jgi:hypothetical protein